MILQAAAATGLPFSRSSGSLHLETQANKIQNSKQEINGRVVTVLFLCAVNMNTFAITSRLILLLSIADSCDEETLHAEQESKLGTL